MAASDHLQDRPHPSTLHHSLSSSSLSSLDANTAQQGPSFPPTSAADATTPSGGVHERLDPASPRPVCPQHRTVKSSVKNGNKRNTNKRVSWDRIHTREFALVVGDHPMCQDSLPVSLGWQYDDHSCSPKDMNQIVRIQQKGMGEQSMTHPGQQQQQRPTTMISERLQSYVFPRRLSYQERKERLVSVSNLTLEQIRNEEIDLVVRKMKESWEMHHNYSESHSDDDMIMTPVQTVPFFSSPVDDNLMELDDIEVVPGTDGQDLGDITNFQWIDN